MTLLQLSEVTCQYGSVRAVDRLELIVSPGERLAITGPNGAGKSTVLGLVDGTVAATAGAVRFCGRTITTWPVHRRAAAGIARVFQHPMIAPRHTALGNILLAVRRADGLGLRLKPHRPAVARLMANCSLDILARAGLADQAHTLAAHLSYGHLRQLDLAIALALEPRLLLLDEPTAGLSATETARIVALLQQLPSALTVILVEHDHEVVEAVATRTLTLHQGRPDHTVAAA
jgi:branched-chain amino acid transport system ATP-binding protein